jgi:plastocyanin
MRRIVTAAAAAALCITGLFASPANASSIIWHIQAGSAAFAPGPFGLPLGGGNRFYPDSIAIHPGDSVAFTPIGAHTITFNRPAGPVFAFFGPSGVTTVTSSSSAVNSGIIGAGPPPQPAFTVTFASTLPAGRYKFICMLHVGMSENIDVLPISAALPKTDAQYGAMAQREVAKDLEKLADIADKANKKYDGGEPTVLVGAGDKRVSNLRFFPSTITIHKGQTITFLKTQDPTEPHTVTFGPENPDEFLQLLPSGGTTYNGTGTVNSGFLSTKRQFKYYQLAGVLPPPVKMFKVTFTAVSPPTGFSYICELHDDVGMRANVIVVP